jgi:hypothetical protein
MTMGAQRAHAYDFTVTRLGSHHVVQGYPHYSALVLKLVEGPRDYAHASVEGLPPGVTLDFPDARLQCCGMTNGVARLYTPNGLQRLLLQTSPTTPAGLYRVLVRVTSKSVERTVSFDLRVHPVPVLARQPIAGAPEIPERAAWELHMRDGYRARCVLQQFPRMGLGNEAEDWYYDGARVRYQIAAYTGEQRWIECGDAINEWYRTQVLAHGLTGWRVFPHGLRMHFARTREPASLAALRATITKSAFGTSGGGVDAELIRETAYMIQAYMQNERAGEPRFVLHGNNERETLSGLERSVAYGIGHLEQYMDNAGSGEAPTYHQPFMAGLMMEALIEYDEFMREMSRPDPRIPWVVARTADWLWATAWSDPAQAFYYDNKAKQPTPDLNLMIAPAYAWLWRMTGDPKHQARGDAVFAGGVRRAWLGDGKHFNQNYRWSFDFVRWRRGPGTADRRD